MKRFHCRLEVVLTEIGDAEPKEKPPSISDDLPKDSPIRDVAQMFEKLQERGIFPGGTATPVFPGPYTSGASESTTMNHHFEMIVRDFEEQQSVLAKFRKVADALEMPFSDPPSGFDLPLAKPEAPDLPLES